MTINELLKAKNIKLDWIDWEYIRYCDGDTDTWFSNLDHRYNYKWEYIGDSKIRVYITSKKSIILTTYGAFKYLDKVEASQTMDVIRKSLKPK